MGRDKMSEEDEERAGKSEERAEGPKRKAGRTLAVVVLTLVICAGIGAGIWYATRSPRRYTGPVEKLKIGMVKGEYSALVMIAKEEGYYRENGLVAEIVECESGVAAVDALLKGNVDVATASDVVLVSNSFKHEDLRALCAISSVNNIKIIGRKDRGLSQPSDLKGKKIAVTAKSSGEYFLGTFLTFNGLSMRDVSVVDLPPKALIDATVGGTVDAAITWNPNAYRIVQALGDNAVTWPAQNDLNYFFLLTSTDEIVRARPAAVERLLGAMVQAQEFVEAHPTQTKVVLERSFSLDPEYLKTAWNEITFSVELEQALLLIMGDEARWNIENGLTESKVVPNYFKFLYLLGLEKVKPEAVTVIR
jgi:NitT/TauT family transport system substrate-binding protein